MENKDENHIRVLILDFGPVRGQLDMLDMDEIGY